MSQAKNFEQIRADYLRDLQNQDPAAHVHSGSDNHVRATALAALAEGQYRHQEWILRQAFADTADSAYLEKHASKYGIYRKAPTTATGKLRVTGAAGAVIKVGQQVNIGNAVYTVLTEAVIGRSGSAEVAVAASAAGSSYNQDNNAAAVLQSVPAGVDAAAVMLEMVGGTDAETDESLLARYEERLRTPAAGGNARDFRNWCLEVPGVVDAYIYPLRRGMGFVDAVIIGQDGVPNEEVLAAVQQHVDAVRPVTRKNGFLAIAPAIQPVDVTVSVTIDGTTTDAAAEAVEAAIRAYFDTLRPGDTLIRSQMETLISEVYGVVDRHVKHPAANLKPKENEDDVYWLRVGNIKIEYAE